MSSKYSKKASGAPNAAAAGKKKGAGGARPKPSEVVSAGLAMLTSSGYTPLPVNLPMPAAAVGDKSALPVPLHEFATLWASRSDACARLRESDLMATKTTPDEQQQQQQQRKENDGDGDAAKETASSTTAVDVPQLLKMREWVTSTIAAISADSNQQVPGAHDVAVLRSLLLGGSGFDRSIDSAAAATAQSSAAGASKQKGKTVIVDIATCDAATLAQVAQKQLDEVMDPFLKSRGWI